MEDILAFPPATPGAVWVTCVQFHLTLRFGYTIPFSIGPRSSGPLDFVGGCVVQKQVPPRFTVVEVFPIACRENPKFLLCAAAEPPLSASATVAFVPVASVHSSP